MVALVNNVGLEISALDFFCGWGGSSQGIHAAGATLKLAANHDAMAIDCHSQNWPGVDHRRADLSNPDSKDYADPATFPYARFVWASPSCRFHSKANAKKIYARGPSLLDEDDDFDNEAYAKSERSRVTMLCPLRYAAHRKPEIVVIENVVEACFIGDTIVVTKRGLIPIKEVRVGDVVMTHQARWKPVTAVRTLIRDTVKPKGYCNSIIECTPDHQFYAREVAPRITKSGKYGRHESQLLEPTWVAVQDLPKAGVTGSAYDKQYGGYAWATPSQFPRYWVRPPKTIGIDTEHDPFWYMVGRWLGDGWLNKAKKGPNRGASGQKRVRICCNVPEADELEAWLDKTGLSWCRYQHTASVEVFEAHSTKLVDWLRHNFGEYAHGKRLPAWVFSLTPDQRRALVDGYVGADGTINEDGRVYTSSVSRALSVGIRLLVESLGRPAAISQGDPTVKPTFGPWTRSMFMQSTAFFTVSWTWHATEVTKATESERHRWGRVNSVIPTDRQELVYDITVADDHSFIADGQVVHNCQWGPNRDGSTFRWWLREWQSIGYDFEVCFLNSMFFPPCPQSRDRVYIVFWRKGNRKPNLDFRPAAYCVSDRCGGKHINAVQVWKPRRPSWPLPRWGRYGIKTGQYFYACSDCGKPVEPAAWPAYTAIDWSNLGPRIGERADHGLKPLAPNTMERIRRGLMKFRNGPPIILPAKSVWGTVRPVTHPHPTQTSVQEWGMAQAGVIATAMTHSPVRYADNRARRIDEQLFTLTANQIGQALATRGIMLPVVGNTFDGINRGGDYVRVKPLHDTAYTQHTTEAFGFAHMPFVTEMRGGGSKNAGQHLVSDPAHTVTAGGLHHGLTTPAIFAKFNGGPGDTAWHPVDHPTNTITCGGEAGIDSHGLVVLPWVDQWMSDPIEVTRQFATVMTHLRHSLASVPWDEAPVTLEDLDEVRYRMFTPDPELRRIQAFEPTYKLIGSDKDKVRGLGNSVTPPVATAVTERCLATLSDDTDRMNPAA